MGGPSALLALCFSQVIRGEDAKGFKLLRFTSAVTSLAVESRGKFLLAGTDSGCIHAVAVDPWPEAQVPAAIFFFSFFGSTYIHILCITIHNRLLNIIYVLYRLFGPTLDLGLCQVVDTNRISEVGIAKLCCTGSEETRQKRQTKQV